jgi:hypothetical protein
MPAPPPATTGRRLLAWQGAVGLAGFVGAALDGADVAGLDRLAAGRAGRPDVQAHIIRAMPRANAHPRRRASTYS